MPREDKTLQEGRCAHAEHCGGRIGSVGRWRMEEIVRGRDQWAILKCQLAFDISLSFPCFECGGGGMGWNGDVNNSNDG